MCPLAQDQMISKVEILDDGNIEVTLADNATANNVFIFSTYKNLNET